jgi:hypothetical protein
MPSTHTSLHYHLIFATKHRQPVLAKEWRHELHSNLDGRGTTKWSAEFIPPGEA